MSTKSRFQLGVVSAILPELTLNQWVEFAAGERFECIEIMCWPMGKAERRFAGVTHVDVASLTEDQAAQIRELFASRSLGISGLGYYPNPLDPDPKVSAAAVAHLKKVIIGAEMLGLDTVNTFVGRDWTQTIDENWPRFLKVWKPLIKFAENHGVRIGIENCPMLFTRDEWPGGKNLAVSPAIWRRMFNDISSKHFGLNYDPSHLVLQQMDPASPLKEFQDKLFHIHAKDVRIHQDRLNEHGVFAHPLLWHQPRIPGFGELDWGRFLGSLMETEYSGPICIEVEDDTFGKTLEGRKNAVRVARNVLTAWVG